MTSILLTFFTTSFAWFTWYQWHRPRLVKIVAEETLRRCHLIFREALVTAATEQIAIVVKEPDPSIN